MRNLVGDVEEGFPVRAFLLAVEIWKLSALGTNHLLFSGAKTVTQVYRRLKDAETIHLNPTSVCRILF